jgi:hypothetical protein
MSVRIYLDTNIIIEHCWWKFFGEGKSEKSRDVNLVEKGRVFGAIRNAKQQQHNYEQEILRLKEQIENLKKLNDKLIAENKLLHGIADEKTKGKGGTEIGDVGF